MISKRNWFGWLGRDFAFNAGKTVNPGASDAAVEVHTAPAHRVLHVFRSRVSAPATLPIRGL